MSIGDNALALDFRFHVDAAIRHGMGWRNGDIHQMSPFHEEATGVKIAKVPARD